MLYEVIVFLSRMRNKRASIDCLIQAFFTARDFVEAAVSGYVGISLLLAVNSVEIVRFARDG
jgi:hypothetical protein